MRKGFPEVFHLVFCDVYFDFDIFFGKFGDFKSLNPQIPKSPNTQIPKFLNP